MRLHILDSGYRLGARVLFALVRMVSGRALPDAAKLVYYRPGFYGAAMRALTHEVMRGASAWCVGERELMAAVVSQANACAFCVGAHSATAAQAYGDRSLVASVLADLDGAPVPGPLRVTLQLLRNLTVAGRVEADEVRAVLAAGVSRQQVEDALAVCFAFNVTDRLADAFGFEVLSPDEFDAGAKVLLSRGYR